MLKADMSYTAFITDSEYVQGIHYNHGSFEVSLNTYQMHMLVTYCGDVLFSREGVTMMQFAIMCDHYKDLFSMNEHKFCDIMKNGLEAYK